jgi:hypothetical protein
MYCTYTYIHHVAGHWIVEFKAYTLYKPSYRVDADCYVFIKPPPNRGSAALVKINILGATNNNSSSISSSFNRSKQLNRSNNNNNNNNIINNNTNLQVDFQRQKYNYIPTSQLGDASVKFPNGVFSLSAYPVALPLSQYINATGIKSEVEVDKLVALWGKILFLSCDDV